MLHGTDTCPQRAFWHLIFQSHSGTKLLFTTRLDSLNSPIYSLLPSSDDRIERVGTRNRNINVAGEFQREIIIPVPYAQRYIRCKARYYRRNGIEVEQ